MSQQIEGHRAYEIAHSSFSLVSFSAYPLVGPRLYPGGLGVVVSELDAGGQIGHFFATFFLAATRLALASAFRSAASFASRSTFNRAVFARVACVASRYSVMATLPSSTASSKRLSRSARDSFDMIDMPFFPSVKDTDLYLDSRGAKTSGRMP